LTSSFYYSPVFIAAPVYQHCIGTRMMHAISVSSLMAVPPPKIFIINPGSVTLRAALADNLPFSSRLLQELKTFAIG